MASYYPNKWRRSNWILLICFAINKIIHRTVDTVPRSTDLLVFLRKGCNYGDLSAMIKGCFSIEEQVKVSKSRTSKSRQIAVVVTGVGMGISNVANNDRVYDTNLGLSDKEL